MANNYKSKQGDRKEFTPSIGFWPTKKGTGYSVQITDELLDVLVKAQVGGRLFLSGVPEESYRYNDDGRQLTPSYRVAIFPPDEAPRAPKQNDSL
jgi:hypothetical protein